MSKNRKKAAAITAVLHYLQEEEAAVALAALSQGVPATAPAVSPPPQPVKLWAVSGRQAQMEMRTLMQMKAFHRR